MTDSVHDMGGVDGFGKVEPEPNEPAFHEKWEGRVMAINRVMGAGGAWNIDMSRSSRELLPPVTYLASSYYGKWLIAMENLAVERGFVGRDELAAGHSLRQGKPLKRGMLKLADLARVLTRGSFTRPTNTAARFKIGDRVRARNIHPKTHTRLPRYVRGHVGVIERIHGTHVFPDTAALDQGDNPQWLYTVVFDGRELWGDDADPTLKVSVDAFEPYLERA